MSQHKAIRKRLLAGLDGLGLSVSDKQSQQLLDLLSLLQKWSKAYNLTAIRAPGAMVDLHILDSLSIARLISGQTVLDVGTGAGFPGLPLAILQPEREFTLLDASDKKLRFVRQAAFELGLENLSAVHARVPEYAPEPRFDTVTARAFASLGDIVRDCAHLLSEAGRIVAMKGQDPSADAEGLGPEWAFEVLALQVPGLDHARHAIVLTAQSNNETPKKD